MGAWEVGMWLFALPVLVRQHRAVHCLLAPLSPASMVARHEQDPI